ncbi:unnamed protein product [Hymenolepis diminuta]|uniref:NR LBD domain-containing protein n=1 Tax=Hymenolepis diminuta TaxID=6216 RepID=A0A0R3ST73_HYMDI|nr:unnamed protein product [Hymenolepis diminuta]
MDNMVSSLVSMAAYSDHIIEARESEKEPQDRIEKLLECIKKYAFRPRADKCQFFLTSVKLLGSTFDSIGRRPNPDETRAIFKIPASKNFSSLRSFLRLI